MTVEPTIGAVGEYLYDYMRPLAWDDANRGWATKVVAGAFGAAFEQLNTIVNGDDSRDDWLPWEIVFDVDVCPAEALPYLAMFVGVVFTPGMTETDQRDAIRSTGNFGRGSAMSMAVAAARYLTGTKLVVVRVRYDGSGVDAPLHVQVLTRASETTNEAAMVAAVLAMKPGGLAYDIRAVTGQPLQQVKDHYATLDDIRTHYATLQDIRDDPLT